MTYPEQTAVISFLQSRGFVLEPRSEDRWHARLISRAVVGQRIDATVPFTQLLIWYNLLQNDQTEERTVNL